MIEYSLNDFLLFSADVYWRLIDVYLQNFGAVAVLANIGLLLLLIGLSQSNTPRLIFMLMAPLWVWMGWRFYIIEYASINWASYIFGLISLLQAPFFLALSVKMRTREYEIDYAILITAIVYVCLLRPFIMWPLDQDWQMSAIGLLPVPTALLSFGLLLALKTPFRWLMLLAPLILLIVESMTLFLLSSAVWQEIPVIIALFIMLSASVKYRGKNSIKIISQ